MVITVLKPSFFAMFTPGAIALRSTKEVTWRLSRSCPLSTVIAWDKSCRLSLRFSEVTITSSKTSLDSWPRVAELSKTRIAVVKDLIGKGDGFIRIPYEELKTISFNKGSLNCMYNRSFFPLDF